MSRFVINILILILLFCTGHPLTLFSQCGNGQTPMTAVAICSSDTISQGTVAACTPQYVPYVGQYTCVNYNPMDYYTGKPMWYRFHCYTDGTFGFFLKFNTNDTYEWQLYDITGHNPNDVFTNDTLAILGSWFVNMLGYKGTAPNQLLIFGCALGSSLGNLLPFNLNTKILSGHDYLLLINHRSSTPDYGYQFTISGGTAIITSPVPTLKAVSAKCGLAQIGVKLSKKIENGSIAVDGSDFKINNPLFSITNAIPFNALPGFETDSITLTLNKVLLPGSYNISVKKGTDNNTLYDYCQNSVASGNNLSFTIGNSRALIKGPAFCCPNDMIIFTDSSKGNIVSWNWDFGNGNTSTLQNPTPQSYPVTANAVDLQVRLTIKDLDNCVHSVANNIKILNNCYIAVPSAFTPNNDGVNDYLYPLNAWKAKDLVFRVYNRFGQLVFFTEDWTNKWNGTFKGQQESPGIYVWALFYVDENNKKVAIKGTTILIRQ
jgi:gliding motility-associated-like protein